MVPWGQSGCQWECPREIPPLPPNQESGGKLTIIIVHEKKFKNIRIIKIFTFFPGPFRLLNILKSSLPDTLPHLTPWKEFGSEWLKLRIISMTKKCIKMARLMRKSSPSPPSSPQTFLSVQPASPLSHPQSPSLLRTNLKTLHQLGSKMRKPSNKSVKKKVSHLSNLWE